MDWKQFDGATTQQLLRAGKRLGAEDGMDGVLRALLAEAVDLLAADGGLARAGSRDPLFLLLRGDWQTLPANGGSLVALARQQHPDAHVLETPISTRYDTLDACLVILRRKEPFTAADEDRLAALATVAVPALEHAHAARRLQEVSRHLVDAQEAERRHLARELHDSAGQTLTALKLALSLLHGHADAASRDGQLLDDAVQMVDTVHEEIRAISQALQPPQLERAGLHGTLRALCHDFGRRARLQVRYDGTDAPPLDSRAATALYRLLQEALSNVAQHAGAKEVTVRLTAGEGAVTLTIHDDGAGIDPQQPEGAGLTGLRERFALAGGSLEVTSPPDGGTMVSGRVPVITL
jgi:signal transduction histidine kinase